MNKTDFKKIGLFVLLSLLILRLVLSFPFDDSLPGGTDTSSHLFRSLHASQGAADWSYGWYGGFWFYSYPPLFYFLVGSLTAFSGIIGAYKILANSVFVLLPLAFYFLLKEFKIPEKYRLFALATFSLMPFYSYYLYDGRLPSLLALFVGIFFWKFQLRYLKNKSILNLLLSSSLLALSILSHHLTALILFVVVLIWGMGEKGIRVLKDFLLIGILGFLLSAWWSVPFFVGTVQNPVGTELVAAPESIGVISDIISSAYASDFFSFAFSPMILIMLEMFTIFLVLTALYLSKTARSLKSPIIVLLALLGLSLLMSFKRALVVLPLPLSILMAMTVKEFGNLRTLLGTGLMVLLLASFLSLSPSAFQAPGLLQNLEDRVLYLPEADALGGTYYEVFLPALQGNENILGWYPQSQSSSKIAYNNLLSKPLDAEPLEYYSLLRAGYVNAIVIGKDYRPLIEYFTSSGLYEVEMSSSFFIFRPKESFSYIETEEGHLETNFTKTDNKIVASFTCTPGQTYVKESFDGRWQATLNGESIILEPSEYGFISFYSNETGPCSLEMKFIEPLYSLLAKTVSVLTALGLICFSARKIITMPRPKRVRI